LEKLKALLKGNPNLVFSKDTNGMTPLYWAAARGHKDVAELLLANKAEVNAKDNHGQTPLHVAAAEGHKDVVELLRQHGGHD
jgi:ankyrin repeat protein